MVKSFKKGYGGMLSIILLFVFVWSVQLYAAEFYVYDTYGVFSEEELIEINQEIAEVNEQTGIDFAVIFLSDIPADSPATYYHDLNTELIQEYDFGQGEEKTAVLMSVDMENRHIQITAYGEMYETYRQDETIQSTIRAVGEKLKEDDYTGAVRTFVNYSLSYYWNTDQNSDQNTENDIQRIKIADQSIWEKIWYNLFRLRTWIGTLIISLIILVVAVLSHNNNPKVSGINYEKKNSFHLNHRIDRFLYTHTSTRTISDNSSSSSGGGFSNTSSGGYSGGGGKF